MRTGVAFYRAHGEPGDIRHAEWFVLSLDRVFAGGSYTFEEPLPFGLTVADQVDSETIVLTETSAEEVQRRLVPRRVFQEQLGIRYELAGIAEQEQLFAPPDLQVEVILRAAVPFLRD
jgi:hypothetical protein